MKHKLFLLLPTLIWAALPLSGSAAGTRGTLFDAAEQQPARLWKPEQKATYENGSLRLEWDTDRNNICDMTFPKRRDRPIAAFDEANCLVELELPPNSPVNNFNVRFIDSRDEVFQWRVPLVAGKGGKRVVKLKISPKNFFVSFRGNADGRIDFPIYFYSCATSAPRGGGKVSLTLNKIDFESTRKTELHEARFELETGNTPRILLPGRERNLTFLLSNPGQTPLVCDATFTLQDTLGHVITLPKERLIIPARGKITRKPELSLPARGIWYVTLRLEREDGSYVERIRSFALMSPAGPLRTPARTDAFLFGVCVPSISRPQLFDREAETAALCGATALRANFRWRDMERKPGLWDLSVQEKLLKSYGKYHIEVLPILSNPPAWARRDRPNSTPDFTAWREYTGRMFRHFRGRIRFWEIWNEPDLRGKQCWTGSMESFAKFFVIVLKRLKAEFPELKIGGPAFSGFNEKHYRCVLDACKAAGVEPDFLSFHRYSAKLKQMKDIVENSGKLLQEYGFDRCEMILNEWHYIVDWNAARGTGEEYKNAVLSPSGLFGIDSAAFNVAVIALLHDTALDRAFYYGCDPFNIWGYYDIYRGLNKNYYSMVAVGDLMKNYRKRLHARAGVNVHLLGGISDDGRRAQLLAASYRTPETEIVLSLKNAGRYAMEAKILDHEHNFEPAKITVLNDRVILHKNRPGSAVFILDIRQL